MTLPVAFGWGAALSAVATGVHLYNKKNENISDSDENTEEKK
jgi:hypothetical protein